MTKTFLTLTMLFCSLYTLAQIPTDSLKAYYSFNGNSNDEIGINDGIIVGNVTPAEDRFGNPNCAYHFDGEPTSVILIQGFQDFQIDPDSSCTISLWYQGGSEEDGDYEFLFLKRGEEEYGQPQDYALMLYDLNKAIMNGGGFELWMGDGIVPIPDPEWHHLVGVFTNGHWRMYFDNAVVTETYTDNAVIEDFTSDVFIGERFEGRIDDVAFYNRALTLDEVDELYNAEDNCGTTSIEQIESNIKVFPNPAQHVLTISGDQAIEFILIYDLGGKLIITDYINSTNGIVDISILSKGYYILDVILEDQSNIRKKLLIN